MATASVKHLKYTTRKGSTLEMRNSPLSIAISTMFVSLNKEEREGLLNELKADHEAILAQGN